MVYLKLEAHTMRMRHVQLRRHSPKALVEDLQYSLRYLQVPDDAQIYLVNSITGYNLNNKRGLFFLNKRLLAAFDEKNVHHIDANGRCIPINDVHDYPIYAFMGTNFFPSAYLAAKWAGEGLLIDMGTSSTDIITVYDHQPLTLALDRPDYNRLATGELSFSGILYTPLEYLVQEIPFRSSMALVCPGVANTGDVYAMLDMITAEKLQTDYRTSWGYDNAHQRIARFVCYDDLLVDKQEAKSLANYVFQKQIEHTIDNALKVVRTGNVLPDDYPIIALGAGGKWVTKAVAKKLDKPIIDLITELSVSTDNILSALGAAVIGMENETGSKFTEVALKQLLFAEEVESNV